MSTFLEAINRQFCEDPDRIWAWTNATLQTPPMMLLFRDVPEVPEETNNGDLYRLPDGRKYMVDGRGELVETSSIFEGLAVFDAPGRSHFRSSDPTTAQQPQDKREPLP